MDNVAGSRVSQLRSQGYSNDQILSSLQTEGFSQQQIFDAINAGPGMPPPPPMPPSDLPSAPSGAPDIPPPPSFGSSDPVQMPQAPMPPPMPSPELKMSNPPPESPVVQEPALPSSFSVPDDLPVAPSVPSSSSSFSSPPPGASGGVSTEEYVEAIIDEKWEELEHDVQKIIDWKNRSEQQILELNAAVNELKERFEQVHGALIGKIDSYDKNILEVGAEIKAMEKVFAKVLPVFTDNVKQLQDVTHRLTR